MKNRKAKYKLGIVQTLAILTAAYLSASPVQWRSGKREVASLVGSPVLALYPNAGQNLLTPYALQDMQIENSYLTRSLLGPRKEISGAYGSFAELDYTSNFDADRFQSLNPTLVDSTLMGEMQQAILGVQHANFVMESAFAARHGDGFLQGGAHIGNPMFETYGDRLPLAHSLVGANAGGLGSDRGTAWGANDFGAAKRRPSTVNAVLTNAPVVKNGFQSNKVSIGK